METFYLIDFENVHNEGLENINALTKNDHVHIFYTDNALNISLDIVLMQGIDMQGHKVPVRKQSLDMHLVSYLGYLLGINKGKECTYVIISKDTDYDNIIKFWQGEGHRKICRKKKIAENTSVRKKSEAQAKATMPTQTINNRINAGMAYEFLGEDRSALNLCMQHGLLDRGYSGNAANSICKIVVRYCNDERMLSGIHNAIKAEFDEYLEVYEDVKEILEMFVSSKSRLNKRKSRIQTFVGQHFKKKIYVEKKEEIIQIILNAKNRQQINNALQKLYGDNNVVKHMLQTLKPLIKDLPQ